MTGLFVGASKSLAVVVVGLATVVVLALSAGLAVAASDHPKYLAPPGNPAVSQYLEVVPNSMGSSPPRSSGKPPSSLTPAERGKLDHLGANGKALATVVEETAPPAAQAAPSAGGSGASTAATTTSSSDAGSSSNTGSSRTGSSSTAPVPGPHSLSITGSGSSVSAVLSAAAGQGGGGGMGIFLPALMAAGVLVVVAAVWRRRGTHGS